MLRITVLILALLMSCAAWADAAPLGDGPFAMSGKSVGGSVAIGSARLVDFVCHKDPVTRQLYYNWELVGGASNVGRVARICGKVTAAYHSPVTDAKWFYVDDGSGIVSDLGDVGVLVYSDEDFENGDYVTLEGTVGVEPSFDSPDRLVRYLRCGPAKSYTDYPVSDEFNSGALSNVWWVSPNEDSVSFSSGSLALLTNNGEGWAEIAQPAPGDWEVEAHLLISLNSTYSWARVGLSACSNQVNMRPPSFFSVTRPYLYNPSVVYVGQQLVGHLADRDMWIRGRLANGTYTQSYSSDGVNYSAEYSSSVPVRGLFIAGSLLLFDGSTVAVDYVRFRRS